MQDIVRRHRRQRAQLLDVDFGPAVRQDVHDRLLPVRPIAQQAQVAERFLGATQLAFAFRQLVAERDEQFAEPLALVLR